MDPFAPPLHASDNPSASTFRTAIQQQRAAIGQLLKPRISQHLAAAADANSTLARRHAAVVDLTDLDLETPTRWLAQWEISGRSIALHRALLDQLRLGYGPETAGTMRMLLEALLLLHVALDPDRDDETRAWLENTRLSPAAARRHVREQEEQILAGLEKSGETPPAVGYVQLMKQAYDWLATRTHNGRESIEESLDRDARAFFYGPSADLLACAAYLEMTMSLTRTLLMLAGTTSEILFRDGWYANESRRLIALFDELETKEPIGLEARRQVVEVATADIETW